MTEAKEPKKGLNDRNRKREAELAPLIDGVHHWSAAQGTDMLYELIARLEKISRMEQLAVEWEYLGNPDLAQRLLALSTQTTQKEGDAKFLSNLVSLLGNMIKRYKLHPSDDIFAWFLSLTDAKEINYYVSLFLPRCPQFLQWPGRWDYLMSMPNIPPKRKSGQNFHVEIKNILHSGERIPDGYKEKIVDTLKTMALNAKSPILADEYMKSVASFTSFTDCAAQRASGH